MSSSVRPRQARSATARSSFPTCGRRFAYARPRPATRRSRSCVTPRERRPPLRVLHLDRESRAVSPDSETSSAGNSLRDAVSAARAEMVAGRDRIRELHERGLDALQVCGRLTSLLDGIVSRLFDAAAADVEAGYGDAMRAD